MNRSALWPSRRLNLVWIAALVLLASIAGAQTSPTVPTLTPAQERAANARAARQAAAQQAAEKRTAAAQNRAAAAQNKAATKNNPGATTATPNAATNGLTAPTTGTGMNTKSGGLPGTTTTPTTGNNAKSGTLPATAATPATAQRSTGTGTVGSGTLAWQTRVYSSTGCVHNGNSAVCTFTFSNQGNEANLVAGGELAGVQLVDDAHVPHKADSAHFMDKYGTQQPRLLVQSGDTGTYVLTFPNVNPQVTSAEFHLRQQIVGGVSFSAAAASTPASAQGIAPK